MTIKLNIRAIEHAASILCAAWLCVPALASTQDVVAFFSTEGLDRYADGSVVADDECYALVWSPKGSSFSGFKADGTLVSSRDRVVLAAPLALGGRCRKSMFQIPAAEYAALEGGKWAVCLVDTRTADGVPAGVEANAPRRVNRWGVVRNGGVEIKAASPFASAAFAAATDGSSATKAAGRGASYGTYAEVLSEVPESAPAPQITAIDVADGLVRLTVAGTVPYLTYGVESGESPDALSADRATGVADGTSGGEIEFEADATTEARFFKVTRAE